MAADAGALLFHRRRWSAGISYDLILIAIVRTAISRFWVRIELAEPGIYDFSLTDYALGGTLTRQTIPGLNFYVTVFS